MSEDSLTWFKFIKSVTDNYVILHIKSFLSDQIIFFKNALIFFTNTIIN